MSVSTRTIAQPIDMVQNEVRNLVLENRTSTPASPIAGQVFFNTTTSLYQIYDGLAWIDLSTIFMRLTDAESRVVLLAQALDDAGLSLPDELTILL